MVLKKKAGVGGVRGPSRTVQASALRVSCWGRGRESGVSLAAVWNGQWPNLGDRKPW